MSWEPNIKLAVLLGSATAVAIATALFFMRERGKKAKTRQGSYVEVGKVTQIFLYPLKSGRGWDLQQADSTRIGLRHDGVRDRLWGQKGEAFDCGDEAADWCSTYLKKPNCRLCYCADHLRKRQLEEDEVYGNLAKHGEEVGFQDLGQYLMISEASLANLNAKLEQPVTSRNFRPNIMVSGCVSHAEDSWKFVKIGEAEFRALKPCTRYRQTTDSKFRKLIGDSPLFGTNLVTEKEGTIHVGDTVFASYN
ncbi:MARC1 [Branchiostoma lanceolatum]|uniref:MARC1 protein n=1 Tax=Branchiostoma lanceolatum TaxID=7740 RepID=A0A8J9ZSQ5_BRALA|nr:MARC1 [Branchiostoma lanceolatum]